MTNDDPQFPRSYKHLHGAPYDDDPGPWPYLAVIAFADRPDYAAIAEALGMPVGSIGPTRGRCLAKLRAALEADPTWVTS